MRTAPRPYRRLLAGQPAREITLKDFPDGRYFAFSELTLDSNAWVIENFR